MRRTRIWIGLPVIELQSGERVGRVSDVLFAPDRKIKSLVVEKDGIFAGKGQLPIDQITSIGEDAITVESSDRMEPVDEEEIGYLLSGERSFVGKQLFTEQGDILGVVADVYIGTDTGNIVGYEVSDGLLADLVAGRKWLPFGQTVQIGDRIIVKADSKLSELYPSM